jgi:hypothetical protein
MTEGRRTITSRTLGSFRRRRVSARTRLTSARIRATHPLSGLGVSPYGGSRIARRAWTRTWRIGSPREEPELSYAPYGDEIGDTSDTDGELIDN